MKFTFIFTFVTEIAIERILALKGIDGKVDPSEIRRAIKLIDPKRIENSLDNIVGLIMQYHNYFQMKKKKGLDDNNNKKKKSGSREVLVICLF